MASGERRPDDSAGDIAVSSWVAGGVAAAAVGLLWLVVGNDGWLVRLIQTVAVAVASGLSVAVGATLAWDRVRVVRLSGRVDWAAAWRASCRQAVESEATTLEAGGRRADPHFLGLTAFTARYRQEADRRTAAVERRLVRCYAAALTVSVCGLIATVVGLTAEKVRSAEWLVLLWPSLGGLVATTLLAVGTLLLGRAWAELYDRWVDWAKEQDAAVLRGKLAVPPSPSEPVRVWEDRRVLATKPIDPLPPPVALVPLPPPPAPAFSLTDWTPPADDNDARS